MKLPNTKYPIALFLSLALAACATMGPQDTDQYIFLDESEVLFVEIRNSTNPELDASMPDVAENMRNERRRDLVNVMQELFQLNALPIDIHLLEEREEPGNGPVLEIIALRFEQDRSGDLVTTIKAKLSKYGELNTLGTYSQRTVSPAGSSRYQMDKAFLDVIRKPLQEMMSDLLEHFPSPEERKHINAPLTELGEN